MAPYLTLIGIESTTNESNEKDNINKNKSSNLNDNNNNNLNGTTGLHPYYPTQVYYPKCELKCVDQKIGTVLIDIKCPVQLGVIKKVILYVHRPIYGNEPMNLIPDDTYLSYKKEHNVNVKKFKSIY